MSTPQLERLQAHCQRLRLYQVAAELPSLLEQAAKAERSYTDFLEEVLRREVQAKTAAALAEAGLGASHLVAIADEHGEVPHRCPVEREVLHHAHGVAGGEFAQHGVESLGQALKLPSWLEPRRDEIEAFLPPAVLLGPEVN